MAGLPADLWVEILKRTDLGALLQCLAVCKSWRCVISSPNFIRSHFSLNSKNGNRPYFLFDNQRCYVFYDPPQSTLRFKSLRFAPLPFLPKLPCPPLRLLMYQVIDVIHGVVCLSQHSVYDFSKQLLLWNPAIHKYTKIPSKVIMPFEFPGFGFDTITKDFKLVIIWCRLRGPDHIVRAPGSECRWGPPAIEVLSAQGGGWRRLVAVHIGPIRF